MLGLILLITLLLIINHELFSNQYSHREKFNQGYINPYFETDFNISGPDNEYYYDRSGRKATMYRMLPPLKEPMKTDKPQKKIDHTNCIVHKLELYSDDVYKCT